MRAHSLLLPAGHSQHSQCCGPAGRVRSHRPRVPPAAAAAQSSPPPHARGVAETKDALLAAIADTRRGSRASLQQRGWIEELQVALESFSATRELDYEQLGGHWLLLYTTARDVLPILNADSSNSPFGPLAPGLRVGNIYQRLTSPVDGVGKVDNIIQLGAPLLLEGDDGVTLTVQASYEVRSGHTIALNFDAAGVSSVRISPELEGLIAPAILPRTPLQHMLLLAIKQFNFRFPFRTAAQVAAGVTSGPNSALQRAGGSYQLTYLDEDMLIGRASALGGLFIFRRAEAPATH